MLRQCLVVISHSELASFVFFLFINEWSRKSSHLIPVWRGALSSLLPWKQGRSRWSHWLAFCRSRGCLWRRSRGESVWTVTLGELTEKLLSLDLSSERQKHSGSGAALTWTVTPHPAGCESQWTGGLWGTRSMFAGASWREIHLESSRWRLTVFLSAVVCCVKLTVVFPRVLVEGASRAWPWSVDVRVFELLRRTGAGRQAGSQSEEEHPWKMMHHGMWPSKLWATISCRAERQHGKQQGRGESRLTSR